MHYCGHYKNRNLVKEVRQSYNQLGSLAKQIKDNNFRIIVETKEDCDLKKLFSQLEILEEKNVDYTVSAETFNILNEILNRKYKAFLNYPIANWELVEEVKKMNMTDIWIDGPLGFDLPAIKKSVGDIKIRIKPNGSTNWLSYPMDITSFFIRPENLELYQEYIDVIDFQEHNEEKEKTLLEIYQRGYFNEKLNYLIPCADCEVSNKLIPEVFGKNRLQCQQKCKVGGRSCHSCPLTISLTQNTINWFKK